MDLFDNQMYVQIASDAFAWGYGRGAKSVDASITEWTPSPATQALLGAFTPPTPRTEEEPLGLPGDLRDALAHALRKVYPSYTLERHYAAADTLLATLSRHYAAEVERTDD